MPGFEVDPDELARHAGQVHQVADQVAGARDAANEVGTGGWDMYGRLTGLIIMPAMALFSNHTGDLIEAAAELVDTCAEGVEDDRLRYEEIDRQLAELLERVGES